MRPSYRKICVACGETFVAHRSDRMYCADMCRRRAFSTARRARKSGAAVYPIRHDLIVSSAGGVCYLCECLLVADAVAPAPDSTVLDHVIPLARGGAHSEANLRVTHWFCNSLKSELLVDEFRVRFPDVRERFIARLELAAA